MAVGLGRWNYNQIWKNEYFARKNANVFAIPNEDDNVSNLACNLSHSVLFWTSLRLHHLRFVHSNL